MGRNINDNTLKWWNNKYSASDAHAVWSSSKRLQFYNMIATAITRKPATILDIGSGFGFGLAHLVGICDEWLVEGLDFSNEACDQAVVKTHCVDIISNDIPGSYDYIISAETLEHFSSPMIILDKMYTAARGAVILTVPYRGAISPIHVSSFSEHSFSKYANVHTELSSDKHFMLVVITK